MHCIAVVYSLPSGSTEGDVFAFTSIEFQSVCVCCKASLAQQRARFSESEKFLIHPQAQAFCLVAYVPCLKTLRHSIPIGGGIFVQ